MHNWSTLCMKSILLRDYYYFFFFAEGLFLTLLHTDTFTIISLTFMRFIQLIRVIK